MMDNIPEDILQQAKKLANTKKGREILNDIDKNGIIKNLLNENKKKIIMIRPNGIIKIQMIQENDLQTLQVKIIKKQNYTITCWYDSKNKFINKRASKFLNEKVGGHVYVYLDEDITISLFLQIEKI